jgi:acetyl-CoA C-acetyltransferase
MGGMSYPEAWLTGFGHTRFGRLAGRTLESLLREASAAALLDAGVDATEIDLIVISTYNHGLVPQGFAAGMSGLIDEGLRYKPTFHVESACASGSAAVHLAAQAIRAGDARRVLVAGAECMSHHSAKAVGDILLSASYVQDREAEVQGGFAGAFAGIAAAYAAKYGDPSRACAMIASKNHRNGLANPDAQLHRDYDVNFCATVSAQNPIVAGTIRRTDCSPISDGAAAIVVSASDAVAADSSAVRLRARAHVTDLMPVARRDMSELDGCRRAWQQALKRSGLGLFDLDLIETHDCFTIAELQQYEAMGLAEPGQGLRALEEGLVMRDGALPVNLSGGLKSKGHPIGATGVSMHVMAARQLLGRAGAMQRDGASIAGVFNMGGMGVSNYVSILERVR